MTKPAPAKAGSNNGVARPPESAADVDATAERVKRSLDDQPVSHVRWVHRDFVQSNSWNPNRVAVIELDLLRRSILENGWTQPIVVAYLVPSDDRATPEGTSGTTIEIVDGYHRYLISGEPDIYDLTDGYLPVVPIHGAATRLDLMAATVRHNRARGTHGVAPMADIIIACLDAGMDYPAVASAFGMEVDEVERLRDRGNMVKRAAQDTFNTGWTPGPPKKGE